MSGLSAFGQIGNQASLRESGMDSQETNQAYGNYKPSVIETLKKIEQKNNVPMTGVTINLNSSFPAQMNARATAFGGSQVDIAPGEESSMSHELGHIVQQRLGMVRADSQVNNRPVCTSQSLEEDATRRGMV